MKNNSPDETPHNETPDSESLHTFVCLTPMYSDGIFRTEWVRLECSNTYKKRPWVLRNRFCALAWDRLRGLFFDWRLKMSNLTVRKNSSGTKLMSSDIRPPNDDRQLSIYELLYVNQCQGISEFIEKMVTDGNMTDSQLERC